MNKLVVDESVDYDVVTELRKAGYDVISIVEINPGIDDTEVLEVALKRKRYFINRRQRFWRTYISTEKEK